MFSSSIDHGSSSPATHSAARANPVRYRGATTGHQIWSFWALNFNDFDPWNEQCSQIRWFLSTCDDFGKKSATMLICGLILRYVTIAAETHLSAQNNISQQEVFNVWSSHSCNLLGGFHWKLGSISSRRPRIEIKRVGFFCNLFCGVARWLLWFVNTVSFHTRNCTCNETVIS